jgi:hypothetical protein
MAEHIGMRSSLLCAGIGTLLVALVATLRPRLKSIHQLPEIKDSTLHPG